MSAGDEGALENFWAQLVCVTDAETPPYMIGKDKFTIGRGKGCDICHENNKLVSGTHCYVLRDDAGKVWLYDSSTNGTLLNLKTKLTKGECREITHGDEFHVVFKKGEEALNIGYVFQDLAKLKEEEEAEESDLLEQTLEYEADEPPQADSTIADDGINIAEEDEPRPVAKRKLEETNQDAGPAEKRAKAEADASKVDSTTSADDGTTATTAATSSETTTVTPTNPDTASRDTGRKEEQKDKDTATASDAATSSTGAAEVKKEGGGGGGAGEKDDAFAETLTCIICQELLHDCISLQPCMHSFCAGCYSEWMEKSKQCPSCRSPVDRINKNHIVNNLVEAYLKEHPEKCRPEEDIKELDAKNKITKDMLYPSRQRRVSDSDQDYDSEPDYSDEGSSPEPPPVAPGVVFGFGTPVFGTASNAYRAVCRHCPGSTDSASGPSSILGKAFNAVKTMITGTPTSGTPTTTTAATPAATTTDIPTTSGTANNNIDQPSTSGAGPSGDGGAGEGTVDRDQKVMPTPPPFQCAPNQNHVLCQCCLQIFPDRRLERNTNPDLPPQQCAICYRSYCHAYWGCRKVDCNGCLTKLKDMKFGKKVLTNLILDNPHESEILKNYLESKGLAVQDMLDACLAKMQAGTYTCPDQIRCTMTGETPLCYACALRNFKALAYQYRYDIPRDQLPAEVTARPDCYWGKNCRTQRNKLPHAQRFNHICNQTRT